MPEDTVFTIRFNQILSEEMSRHFALSPLPLDPDLKVKRAKEGDKGAVIESHYLGLPEDERDTYGRNGFCRVNGGALRQCPPGRGV